MRTWEDKDWSSQVASSVTKTRNLLCSAKASYLRGVVLVVFAALHICARPALTALLHCFMQTPFANLAAWGSALAWIGVSKLRRTCLPMQLQYVHSGAPSLGCFGQESQAKVRVEPLGFRTKATAWLFSRIGTGTAVVPSPNTDECVPRRFSSSEKCLGGALEVWRKTFLFVLLLKSIYMNFCMEAFMRLSQRPVEGLLCITYFT